MGCSSSSSATVQLQVPGEQTESRYWHKVLVPSDSVESSSSGEVDRTEVELRALLDYPIGRQFLLDEIRSSGFPPFVDLCLQAWLDIQSFNGMIPSRTQTTMGLSIHRKHIQKNTLVNEAMKQSISPLVKDHRLIVSGIFDQAQALFFKLLHDQMFVQFKGSSQYPVMCATLRRKYNRVKEKDFMYHQMIGQGGFGLVCEVSKKSTGARYAMKLQRKVHMFDRFAAEPWRADIEKRAFASCKHPFIVELFFAFHTESMAVMVTSLGTGRDLSKVLRGAGPLTIEQVRFYAAEITSALSYLHDKGLVYRDLKPGNVLLNMDGHIQLIDFGGVVDINGNTLGICKDATAMSRVLLDSKTKEAPSLPLTRFWTESTSKSLEGAGDPSSSAPSTLEDYGGIQAHRMEGEGWSPGENNVLTDSSAGPDCNALMKQCTTPAVTFMLLRKKFYELSAATVLRHLVACNGDVDKSTTHLEAYMLWREKQFTSTVRPSHQTVGAGCVLFTHGYDSAGHPLVIFTTRLQNMKTRNLDEMVRWCLYIFEEAISRLPPHLEQMTILVNRHGMTQGADFELSKHLFPLLDKYYPHRIHKILLFPVAIYLRGIFGLVKRIAGKSAENLVLVKSINALRNEIPDKYIPFELGGTCEYEFSIDDFPPPVVCEPYEFTKARVDEISVCPFSSKSSSGEADLSINQDSLLPESMSEIANLPRANSIVGTYSYMAPEMMILMIKADEFDHTGYTKAVDWWSLGVSIYRLLTGEYPFKTDIPSPITHEDVLTEGSDRYTVLLEDVDYSNLAEHPDAVDCISKLLLVEDEDRLGYGPAGSSDVSSHPFFSSIDWVQLENRQAMPPPIPECCTPHRHARQPMDLDHILRLYRREEWLDPPDRNGKPPRVLNQMNNFDAYMEFWDYTSPAAVLAELETMTPNK